MLEEFEVFNPWWYTDKWEREDKHIGEWIHQKIKWFPEWTNQISLKPFSLNFIIGPRQVGKTTGIKLLIKHILEKNTDPEKIIYIDIGLISSPERFKKSSPRLRE